MAKHTVVILTTLIILVLIAAACGDEGDGATPVPVTPSPSPTVGTATPSHTPAPPTPMPPTWTPRVTRTQPPRATIVYTYEPVEQPTYFVPTYTPSLVPPSPTPPGPTLLITAAMINDELSSMLAEGSGGLFEAPPTVEFQSGIMLITLNLLTTPGDLATARRLQVQTAVSVDDAGRLTVTALQAKFTDTNAVYDDEDLIGNLTTTLDTILDTVVVQVYAVNTPGSAQFYVRGASVSTVGITVDTVRED